jgi:nitroimidazol reductase NimA-like FMN-containing flavoprotein (pyridoxamine 5'-phosphate oxidase superfamily)
MTREEQLDAVRAVLREQQFAVFAFAGAEHAPPYSAVMFCAETPDLDLVFATGAESRKARYLRDGNGASAQLDTRAAGLANPEDFARVSVQGHLRQVEGGERDRLHALYEQKIPAAAVFLDRPGVLTFRLCPSRIVYARGFRAGFELEFPSR